MNETIQVPAVAFIREATAALMVGVSKRTIQRWEKKGNFPRKVKLGENTSAYKAEDIRHWIEEKSSAQKPKS